MSNDLLAYKICGQYPGAHSVILAINRRVLPQRVWFFVLFGLKTGINFAHFGLELGLVFEETTGAYT